AISGGKPCFSYSSVLCDRAASEPVIHFTRFSMRQFAQPGLSSRNELSLCPLAGIGAIFAALTLVTPFAFQAGGDNAFIALTLPACLMAFAATRVAERTPTNGALWLIFGIGIVL